MNTGQMMLTILAMVLLSSVILTVNRGFLTTNSTMENNRVDILAISLANSIIEHASSLSYDEKTVGAAITKTISLTPYTSLNLESPEKRDSTNTFDDFDDYNCYRTNPKVDSIEVPGTSPLKKFYFKSYCSVDYVDSTNPDVVSTSQTWNKKLTVRIFSPNMADTIRLSTVYCYWRYQITQ
jgi:hypothetical protein